MASQAFLCCTTSTDHAVKHDNEDPLVAHLEKKCSTHLRWVLIFVAKSTNSEVGWIQRKSRELHLPMYLMDLDGIASTTSPPQIIH